MCSVFNFEGRSSMIGDSLLETGQTISGTYVTLGIYSEFQCSNKNTRANKGQRTGKEKGGKDVKEEG